MPNRPEGVIHRAYRGKLWVVEWVDGVRVVRVRSWLIGRHRFLIDRVLENICFGVLAAMVLAVMRRADRVILETWPVFSFLPLLACAKLRAIPALNYFQDLFPEAIVGAGLLRQDGGAERSILSLDRWVCRQAQATVVVSNAMKRQVVSTRAIPPQRVHVVPNWINHETFRPHKGPNTWRREMGIPDDHFVCMQAGTMSYASGIMVLADVAALLADVDRLSVVCVGDGVLRRHLAQRADRLGNLMVLPFQPHNRISEVQSAADVMVTTVEPEVGIAVEPSKVLTYFAVGKPVICAVPEEMDLAHAVRQERLGIVVPPGSATDLAQAIRAMMALDRPEREAMGQRARRHVLRHHSLQAAVDNFCQILNAK